MGAGGEKGSRRAECSETQVQEPGGVGAGGDIRRGVQGAVKISSAGARGLGDRRRAGSREHCELEPWKATLGMFAWWETAVSWYRQAVRGAVFRVQGRGVFVGSRLYTLSSLKKRPLLR